MLNLKVYAHAGETHETPLSASSQAKTIQTFDQDMPMMMDRDNWMHPWFSPFNFAFKILTLILLIVLIRYFWNKGNK